MAEYRNAAKAFTIRDGKLLIVKREPKNVQTPGIWEIPGGRLEIGEDPVEGLKREMLEETGLEVEVVQKLAELLDFISRVIAHVIYATAEKRDICGACHRC